MPVGLEVLSSVGSLQVTSNYKNLAFYDYLDVTVVSDGSPDFYVYQLPVDNTYVYAYRPLTTGVAVGFHLSANRALIVAPANRNTPVRIYRFRRDGSGARANFGLEVFDDSGNLTFSSAIQYLKVLGYMSFSRFGTVGDTAAYNRRPAIIAGNMGCLATLSGGSGRWLWRQRFTTLTFNADNSITVSQLSSLEEFWQDSSPGHLPYGTNSTNAIVIDSSQLP